jgi:hypothetical protein
MDRIIASLLLSVFFLTPIAPAALAPGPAAAPHCIRQPLASREPVASSMGCHEASGHPHHSMEAAAEAATAPDPRSHQFSPNGCCTSHDCCNATVRAQWAQAVAVGLDAGDDRAGHAVVVSATSAILSPRFDANSGRAPPSL